MMNKLPVSMELRERLARKMADLWRERMYKPEWNQLGDTTEKMRHSEREREGEAMGQALSNLLTKDTPKEVVDACVEELYRCMITPHVFAEPEYDLPKDHLFLKYPESYEFLESLDVDYHPCEALSLIAKKVGMHEAHFPIKSHSRISTGAYGEPPSVSVSFGYGTRTQFHYPMEDGRWLVTSLSGTPGDIDLLKKLAANAPSHVKERMIHYDARTPELSSADRS